MALKIRLARGGAKKRPFYRIVVAEATSPRDGRFVERVGSYNPILKSDHPERVVLNVERIKYWVSVGAQPTERVSRFMGQAGIIPMPGNANRPQQSQPKKKAQERMKMEAAEAEAAIEAQKKAQEDARAAAEAAKAAAAAPAPEPVVEAAAEEAPAAVEAPTEEAAAE